MRIKMTVSGDKEIKKALQQIKREVKQKGMLAAVVSGGLIVSNDAKRRAPILTGTLRRSIHVGGAGERNSDFKPNADIFKYTELGKPRVEANTVTAFVGTNLDYAEIQELGTARIPARPFLRPALDENHRAIKKEMAAVLWDFIERAAK